MPSLHQQNILSAAAHHATELDVLLGDIREAIGDLMTTVREVNMTTAEFMELVVPHMKVTALDIEPLFQLMGALGGPPVKDRMLEVVKRAIAAAPKMEGAPANDPGAVECQVHLRSGYRAVGALKIMPGGELCLGSIAQGPKGQHVMLEHYFDVSDIETFVLLRGEAVQEKKSSILVG